MINDNEISALASASKLAAAVMQHALRNIPAQSRQCADLLQNGAHLRVSFDYELDRPTIDVELVTPSGDSHSVIRGVTV